MIPSEHLFLKCRDFVREQSEGEWTDALIDVDARKMAAFIDAILSSPPREGNQEVTSSRSCPAATEEKPLPASSEPSAALKIGDAEQRVLRFLDAHWGWEENCWSLQPIADDTGLTKARVRIACQALKEDGLAAFHTGLFNQDGEVAGSGYCATELGHKLISAMSASPAERSDLARDVRIPPPREESELLEALRGAEAWLSASLECPTWNWDADQREAALFSRDRARAAITAAQSRETPGES